MKPSEFKKNYIILNHLYGAISVEDAYDVLKVYYPDLKFQTMFNDVKKRVYKNTSEYAVCELGDDSYLITNWLLPEEVVQDIIDQGYKERFIPATYEEFLKWEDYYYLTDTEMKFYNEFEKFVHKHYNYSGNKKEDELFQWFFCSEAVVSIKRGINFLKEDEYINKHINIEDMDVMQEFVTCYQNLSNNIKIYANNGYSPNEMMEMHPVDINQLQGVIGPNMKKMIMEGDINPFEFLKGLEESELPKSFKESLSKDIMDSVNEKIKKG